MAISSTGITGRNSDLGSDFFGSINEMPPEPVNGIGHFLEAMSTLPAFRDARYWVLRKISRSSMRREFSVSFIVQAAVGTK